MTDKDAVLRTLTNEKLIDVVKNYRQYGYDYAIRDNAMAILAERGVSYEDLRLTGNLENQGYNQAKELYTDFLRHSAYAFALYLAFVLPFVVLPLFSVVLYALPGMLWMVVKLIIGILYIFFLIRSFMDQSEFYKATGEEMGTGNAILYIVLGMPFYLLAFFYFRSQMREQLQAYH